MTIRQWVMLSEYYSGQSFQQIATKYGVNKSTVFRTVARAERDLREAERDLARLEQMMGGAGVDGN